ncbi:MAG TPA: imidazole glycerol phosphate synthase subunit HisF [Candidatus Acidoferrales bacterium]|nr:imidazole glycerol phosphate synthase subunit HisF [Candidatus Acidoferrales bacterium]
MLVRRIIPCLDIRLGRVVKGVRFIELTDAGDPVTLARLYESQCADELVFLDITATIEGRRAMLDVVRAVAAELTIPFTVGGGVSSLENIRDLLRAGCDKVSVNSAAVRNPFLLKDAADEFGSQCIVLAIDARKNSTRAGWEVVIDGGRTGAQRDVVAWAIEAARMGAGEILLTSIDRDGTKSGFDVELTRAVREAVEIPVIASGGAGTVAHFVDVFTEAQADAALAASLFHYGELDIRALKKDLATAQIPVRPG